MAPKCRLQWNCQCYIKFRNPFVTFALWSWTMKRMYYDLHVPVHNRLALVHPGLLCRVKRKQDKSIFSWYMPSTRKQNNERFSLPKSVVPQFAKYALQFCNSTLNELLSSCTLFQTFGDVNQLSSLWHQSLFAAPNRRSLLYSKFKRPNYYPLLFALAWIRQGQILDSKNDDKNSLTDPFLVSVVRTAVRKEYT